MGTMTKLITSEELLQIVTIDQAIDPFWFDREILYCQEIYLKNLLTEELYYEILQEFDDDDLSPENELIYNRYIKLIVAYGTAFRSIVGNIQTQASNQGVEVNRTEYSNSIDAKERKQAFFLYEKCFHYQKELGHFLLRNTADYPNFDITKIELKPEFFYFSL
jgi:hypothetical protein